MNENAHTFWEAVQNNDNETVTAALDREPTLARKNFNPDSKHTDGFPLYHAARAGNIQMVRALLDAGADPDAKLDTDDPREVGMPLMNALDGGHLDVVHMILDHQPTLNAHPYCATPFVDCLFNNMWDSDRSHEPGDVWQYRNDSAEMVSSLFRYSVSQFLNSDDLKDRIAPSHDEMPELTLLKRVVEMGGRVSLFTLVRHEQHNLIEELLRKCPTEKGSPMDWPQGSVFQNIKGSATWCGYPKTVKACMTFCPTLYTNDVARHSIENAIRSHNRDGGIDQYFELIELQLQFLKDKDAISDRYDSGEPFSPLHWLIEDFIEPSHYGFKCEQLGTTDDLIRLAGLFLDYGFDINACDLKTNRTPLETARNTDGMRAVESFLLEHGATE